MTKEMSKKEATEIIKKLSIEEARDIALNSSLGSIKENYFLKELADEQLPEAFEKKILTAEGKLAENIDSVSLIHSLKTGHALVESIMPRYRGFALKLKKELEKEFDCKSPSEIALVDVAVNAHIRQISNTKLIEERNEPEWLSHERVAFLNFYSREADRAHRQFISAIETLKLIKQPSLNVHIKTNNAFVGENQQFNNNQKQNNESK